MLVLAEPTTELVKERWARALGLGLSRDADAYPVVAGALELRERRERLEEAFRDARDVLHAVATELSLGPQVAIVADRDGVILSAQADDGAIDPLTRLRLVPGAHWGEGTRGTNAIGTAVAEGRAVAVVGRAHYELRNGEIFCYATPVRDAYGELVAVLDVSGPLASHNSAVGMAVQAAGVVLEKALRAMAYGDRAGSALHAMERLIARAEAPELLIEASGRVRMASPGAHRDLPLPHAAQLTCQQVFGVSFAELIASASGARGLRFETTRGVFGVEIDTVSGSAGRTLAALVHFERVGSTRKSGPPAAPADDGPFARVLGHDASLVKAKRDATRFAITELPVLLAAETGTGKELFARAIHAASPRRDRPFVAVNCGALSPELIASELFGYAPGAFTGASRHGSEGRIGLAHGGTLFLDEIAEMPEPLQASLLRVLDDGVYQRVGEAKDRKANFRLVSATCKDLVQLVSEGKFRRDLFYRIRGASVSVPTLRTRSDRIWLAEMLLEELAPNAGAVLADDALEHIRTHDWPGNVRELKAALAHALALSEPGQRVLARHFPRDHISSLAPARGESRAAAPEIVPTPGTRADIVREAIDAALKACGGNVSEAARKLGVGRGTIYRAIQRRR